MSKLYIAYHSGTGNTEEIANLIADYASGWETTVSSYSDADDLAAADRVALGCPASGSEELDEEFSDFFNEVKETLSGKKVLLFGSYGWGDGAYQKDWEDDAKAAGIKVSGTFAQLEAIDDEGKDRLEKEVASLLK